MSKFPNTLLEIASSVSQRNVKAAEIVERYIQRVQKYDTKLKAFISFDADLARNEAKAVDLRIEAGEKLALAGIPIAIKDNISTRDYRTTCASKILENFKPVYDAAVIERLKKAGAIVFGKTNLDEFAMGSSTENSAFFTSKNPWDTSRVPGGSSGGSAVATSAEFAPAALGSDTGGSVRQPAALTGCVGLKPSYGAVSRYGLIAYGSSLDQVGVFAQNVRDCASVFSVIAGEDKRDSTNRATDYSKIMQIFAGLSENKAPLAGLKIGRLKEFFGDGTEKDISSAMEAAIDQLKSLGAQVLDVSIPSVSYSIPMYYVIATAEASSNLARYDGIRYGYRVKDASTLLDLYERSRSEGFGREVKQRIMIGTFVLSSGYYDAYYNRAKLAQRQLTHEFNQALSSVDCLLSPTSPVTAFKIGEKSSDPLEMYLSDTCTVSANLVGLPAISVPCGFNKLGLPIGMQLIGRKFDEATLFKITDAYESLTKWTINKRPNLDI